MILGCTPAVMKPEYIFTAITIIIGVFVAYTAYSQYRLSKEKFKLDMFDKRYGVYKNTQVFLSKILRDAKIEMKDIFEFRAGTQDSVFFFKEDIPNYLKSIDNKALDFWEIHESLNGVPKGEKRSKICAEETELLGWLTRQLPELKNKFSPYLKFKTWK
ncbi:MAG: hypothetical protein E4H40_08100 [Candidatus Brocadiia bacterium]|nr:MAG: hypothetical protein E4H40_08100 [Candidatus Brocadiia bacterium]